MWLRKGPAFAVVAGVVLLYVAVLPTLALDSPNRLGSPDQDARLSTPSGAASRDSTQGHTKHTLQKIAKVEAGSSPSNPIAQKLEEMVNIVKQGLIATFKTVIKDGLQTGTIIDYVKYIVSNIPNLSPSFAEKLRKGVLEKLMDEYGADIPEEDRLKPDGQVIVAIGDLHGDYQCGKLALLLSQHFLLYAPQGRKRSSWLFRDPRMAPSQHLILLGDYLDRGYEGKNILTMLRGIDNMNDQLNIGDTVNPLMGNHELINILYPEWVTDRVKAFVNPGEYWWWRPMLVMENVEATRDSFKSIVLDKILPKIDEVTRTTKREDLSVNKDIIKPLRESGDLTESDEVLFNVWRQSYVNEMRGGMWGINHGALGRFIRRLLVINADGDSLFAHAGLTLKWAERYNGDIDKINEDAYQLVRSLVGRTASEVEQGLKETILDLSNGDAANSGSESILMNRKYASPNKATCDDIRKVLAIVSRKLSEKHKREISLRRMVIGHNPNGISVQCDGMLLSIDNRISRNLRQFKNHFNAREEDITETCTVHADLEASGSYGVAIVALREKMNGKFVTVRRDLKEFKHKAGGSVYLKYQDTVLEDNGALGPTADGHFVVQRITTEQQVKLVKEQSDFLHHRIDQETSKVRHSRSLSSVTSYSPLMPLENSRRERTQTRAVSSDEITAQPLKLQRGRPKSAPPLRRSEMMTKGQDSSEQ